ncbi:hypothetical protein JCM16138_05370 [Thermococcus atlanticus]
MILFEIYPEDPERREIVRRAVGYNIKGGWKLFTQLLEKIHPAPSPEKAFDESEDKDSFGPDVIDAYKEDLDAVTSARATLFHKLLLWALSEIKDIPRRKYDLIADPDSLEYFDPKMDKDHMEEFLSLLLHDGIESGYLTYEDVKRIASLATKLARLTEIYIPDEKTLKLIGDELEKTGDLKQLLEKHPNKGQFYKVAEEIKQEFQKLHGDEIKQRLKKRKEKRTVTSAIKIITEREPALEDVAIESLKRMGVDLKLETGNIPERKSKIFSWLVQNGLIRVEEENGKPVVKATEELNRIVGRYGKATGAMIKWAAEEGVSKEHVEPVAKILGALEEFRQVAKKEDPALAKALEKAMKSKHTVRELLHVSVGLISVEELSERWKDEFGLSLIELLGKNPELTRAFIESMENLSELASHEVPVEWVPLLKMLDGKPPKEELERALERATLLRMVFSAYESLAIRGLQGNGRDITRGMMDILERAKVMVPSADITDEIRAELEVLSKVTALMKDETYIEAIEEEVTQILAKIPETRKIGLFKRESPRRKVEDFVAVLMEGNLSEEEAEERGEELGRYLRNYLDEKEAKELVNNIMIPFRARLLLKRYGTAEDFLFDYAHSKASHLLLLEARLAETLHAREIPPDSILRTMAGAPSLLGRKRVTLNGFERNRETLKRLLG